MNKPTYEELAEALRKFTEVEPISRDNEYGSECLFCYGEDEYVHPDFVFKHEPGCHYLKSQALIERIDAAGGKIRR